MGDEDSGTPMRAALFAEITAGTVIWLKRRGSHG
jgi:hypothetical protein